MSVSTPRGGQLKIDGELRETLYVAGAVVQHDFWVCDGLHVPILGFDFLSNMHAVQDQNEEVISFPFGWVRFVSTTVSDVSTCTSVSSASGSASALESLIQKFSDIIRDDDRMGCTSIIKHDIVLVDEKPFCMKPRPIPCYLRLTVREQLTKMMELGVIEKVLALGRPLYCWSRSQWQLPVLYRLLRS